MASYRGYFVCGEERRICYEIGTNLVAAGTALLKAVELRCSMTLRPSQNLLHFSLCRNRLRLISDEPRIPESVLPWTPTSTQLPSEHPVQKTACTVRGWFGVGRPHFDESLLSNSDRCFCITSIIEGDSGLGVEKLPCNDRVPIKIHETNGVQVQCGKQIFE